LFDKAVFVQLLNQREFSVFASDAINDTSQRSPAMALCSKGSDSVTLQ